MLIPRVVGFKLNGEMPDGTTATDLVLTITEMLRKHGVVGKFVEFYGPGVGAVPLANRATIGNMSPEYGSTVAIFPIDDETVRYLKLTGRDEQQVALVEAYAKEQGLWHDPAGRAGLLRAARARPVHRRAVAGRAEAPAGPGAAGPRQGAVPLGARRLRRTATGSRARPTRPAPSRSRPATRRPTDQSVNGDKPRELVSAAAGAHGRRVQPGTSVDDFELDHGAVVIAAITSCTNTSNPQVMIGAALLARTRSTGA